jgi:hypothetical protein
VRLDQNASWRILGRPGATALPLREGRLTDIATAPGKATLAHRGATDTLLNVRCHYHAL